MGCCLHVTLPQTDLQGRRPELLIAELGLVVQRRQHVHDIVIQPEGFRVVLNRDTQQALQLKLDPMLMDFVDEVVSTPGKR